jgi:tetratricopeptide (TPR) repeat protein
LVRAGERGWDVLREWTPDFDVGSSSLVVPFQAAFGLVEEEEASRSPAAGLAPRDGRAKVREFGGRAEIQGDTSEFSTIVRESPVRIRLDERGEVLATFLDETRDPKTALRHEGDWLADTGRLDEAEAAYAKSLAAETRLPVGYLGMRSSSWDVKRAARLLDALVHLRRARLFLDRGRDAEASAALEAAESLLTGRDSGEFKAARMLLRARLETRRGDFAAAYRRLSGELRLDFQDRQDDSVVEQIRNLRFRSGWVLGGDAYALLAAAAAETGRDEVQARASREAERRGADLGALPALAPVLPAGPASIGRPPR